jgi:glycerol-3-phosphate dehydrogenase (NAD(P)+)
MCLQKIKNIGVLGAGAFGTAIALSYVKNSKVSLFSCFEDHVKEMRMSKENEFLEGIKIPGEINIDTTNNIKENTFDYIFWCFPIKPSIDILNSLIHEINGANIVICSKGLDNNGEFLLDSFKNLLPNSKIGYLSGPNFAIELAKYKLSASNIALPNITDATVFSNDLSHEYFKLNPIDDVIGIQICGAVKNIIAIACGIAVGLKMGLNAQSAILTYGLEEMKKLGKKLGAQDKTFYDLCGIGDLFLTASSDISRNRMFGKSIATVQDCPTSKSACEGYDTINQVIKLAEKNDITMPICQAVFEVLNNEASPKSILDTIM